VLFSFRAIQFPHVAVAERDLVLGVVGLKHEEARALLFAGALKGSR
jgi:hypothetical protein